MSYDEAPKQVANIAVQKKPSVPKQVKEKPQKQNTVPKTKLKDRVKIIPKKKDVLPDKARHTHTRTIFAKSSGHNKLYDVY